MNKPLPTTTATIKTQHSYITLTVKTASGEKVNYTTSYSGSKLSGTPSPFLSDNKTFNALFRAFEAASCKPGENEGQRFERLKGIVLQAKDGQELLTVLQASRTTDDEKRECRRLGYVKHAESDGLPADAFGRAVTINTAQGKVDAIIDGYSEKSFGKLRLQHPTDSNIHYEVEAAKVATLLKTSLVAA